MQLIKPERHTYDPGRIMPPEEVAIVEPTVTPVWKIKSRTCKRERNNDHYRPGRR